MKKQLGAFAAAIGAASMLSPAGAVSPEQKMDHAAMEHGAMTENSDHCGMHMGEGVIDAIDVKKSKAAISHKPIDSIGWPEMRMEFAIKKPVDLSAFATGERVHFLLKAEKDKSYSIAAMCSLDVEDGAHEACMAHMHGVAMKATAEDGRSCDMEGMGDMHGMDHSSHGKSEDAHKGHH